MDNSSSDDLNRGIRSTVSVNGHPIHPMLIPFPIAFLIGAFVTDLAFWGTRDVFWAAASSWLLLAGLIMGLIAAVLGLTDFLTIQRVRSQWTGWAHFLGNGLVLILALVNLLIRAGDPVGTILPGGLILSAITFVVLLFTGWLGGELAYRYKVGVLEGGEQYYGVQPPRTVRPPLTPPLTGSIRSGAASAMAHGHAGEKPAPKPGESLGDGKEDGKTS